MIDLVLFAGRILLVIVLYLFLFATMRTGIGLVRGQRRDTAIWSVDVEKGARSLRGLHVDILGPVVVGRDPGSDIVIAESYISARQARFSLLGRDLFIEDLGSTNGTCVNGAAIEGVVALMPEDTVSVGNVSLRVRYS